MQELVSLPCSSDPCFSHPGAGKSCW